LRHGVSLGERLARAAGWPGLGNGAAGVVQAARISLLQRACQVSGAKARNVARGAGLVKRQRVEKQGLRRHDFAAIYNFLLVLVNKFTKNHKT
jgi:hypothetical protein